MGAYKIHLLIGKSKVAPVKAQSVPRLELCAALLLVRTWKKFEFKLENYVTTVNFWTDSITVLRWLKTHSTILNSFVANRVSEIQQLSQSITWRHVPSKANPADIISRGCSAADLCNTIWFSGPPFLNQEKKDWPQLNPFPDSPVEEQKKRKAGICYKASIASDIINDILNHNSSYSRTLRILVYIHRTINKIPPRRGMKTSDVRPVSSAELNDAFYFIAKVIQHDYYSSEISALKTNKCVNASFQKLSPFLCELKIFNNVHSVIRVGGRLLQAPIPIEAKFPLLLPHNHRFTIAYIEHLHRSNLHAGPKVLISLLRQRIWIVRARDTVRKVVRNCVHCFKYRPRLQQQIMGSLPADRFYVQRPFYICGVDFCGPFATSYRIRSKVPYKTYVAIFICFATKAIHMELVSDLSSDAFIGCLKRFISRRGIPQRIYCDNATNFVGAHNKLNTFYHKYLIEQKEQTISQFSATKGFEFCFIPPRSPHFGGLWEAAVKSAKQLFTKHLTQAGLTYEELLTIVVEAEGILNSRPLVTTSNDPNDGDILTPSHFLIGEAISSLPEAESDVSKYSYLSRWQRITHLKQLFWHQWRRDYIHELQQRSKWLTEEANVHIGQLVLLHEDNVPSHQWPLGRITNIIIGPDRKVRVVDVKTSKGTFRRAIHKLAPLPSEN